MKIAFTYKKQNIFSYLTAKLTKSKWSHTFLVLDNIKVGKNDCLILESNFFGGVKFGLLSVYKNNPKVVMEILNVSGLNDDIEVLTQYIGKKWGYLQVIGFMGMKLFKKVKNPIKSGLWCSELVWLKLITTDKLKNVFITYLRDSVTPEDIYKELKKL